MCGKLLATLPEYKSKSILGVEWGDLNQSLFFIRAACMRFKIFNQIDADGSGNLSYDELVSCARASSAGWEAFLRLFTRG